MIIDDLAFVRDILRDNGDAGLVKALGSPAHSLQAYAVREESGPAGTGIYLKFYLSRDPVEEAEFEATAPLVRVHLFRDGAITDFGRAMAEGGQLTLVSDPEHKNADDSPIYGLRVTAGEEPSSSPTTTCDVCGTVHLLETRKKGDTCRAIVGGRPCGGSCHPSDKMPY